MIFSSMKRKNPEKQLKHDDRIMPKNIYETKTYSEYYKKFNAVHFIFKYKLVVPLLRIAERMLGNTLVSKAPPGHHNRNLKIFNESFDEAVTKWINYSIRNTGASELRMTKKQCALRAKNDKNLHTIKKLINTMYVYDTAYRDFINVFLHEVALGMTGYYSKVPGKKTGHLFHTVDLYEVQYFVLEKYLTYNTKLELVDAKSLYDESPNK